MTANLGTDTGRLRQILPFLTIAAVVLVIYGRTGGFAFTNWDDRSYILDNPLLWSSAPADLIDLILPGNIADERLYIPLTYLSFRVDALIFGQDPNGFHAVNVLLHLANGCLVYMLLLRWFPKARLGALAAALLFVVHPLQVEPVAWIMGRKDLLSLVFTLAAMIQYDRFLASAEGRPYRWAIALFALAMLAKPAVVLLPGVLLLMHIVHGRAFTRRDISVLLPFAAISVIVLLINSSIGAGTGAVSAPLSLTFHRALYIPPMLADWIPRLLLLTPSEIMYLPSVEVLTVLRWLVVPSVIFIMTFWAVSSRHTKVWTFIAAAALLTLPALALVALRDREFITADRYLYLPAFAFLAAALAIHETLPRLGRRALGAVAVFFIIAGSISTWRLVPSWENSTSLWTRAVKIRADNTIAWNSLGNAFMDAGSAEKAVEAYETAIAVDTRNARAHYNLGVTLSALGRPAAAAAQYRQALNAEPNLTDARFNLAIHHMRSDEFATARTLLLEAVQRAPRYGKAWNALGLIRERGESEGARADASEFFRKAVAADPRLVQPRFKLALYAHEDGAVKEAEAGYEDILRIDDMHLPTLSNLARIRLEQGRFEDCLLLITSVLLQTPNDTDTVTMHAHAVHGLGKHKDAIVIYERALKLAPDRGLLHVALVRLYLDTDNWPRAKAHAESAYGMGITLDQTLIDRLANADPAHTP